jgi:N-acetylglucosamine kinase-like BadF-type ATPase
MSDLSKPFADTVTSRLRRDPEFAIALLEECSAEIAHLRKMLQIIAEQAETLMLPDEMQEALDDIAAMARAALDGEADT